MVLFVFKINCICVQTFNMYFCFVELLKWTNNKWKSRTTTTKYKNAQNWDLRDMEQQQRDEENTIGNRREIIQQFIFLNEFFPELTAFDGPFLTYTYLCFHRRLLLHISNFPHWWWKANIETKVLESENEFKKLFYRTFF